jgi:DNA-binding NarL/FixJ family response regulator
MQSSRKNVLIIDDHKLFADGLALILSGLGDGINILVSNDAAESLADEQLMSSIDLALIDLHMPRFNGFAFLTAVATQWRGLTVAVISGSEKPAEIERTLKLGALGFIPKNSESDEMLAAVAKLLSGERYLPAHWDGKINWVAPGLEASIDLGKITERQRQVISLMRDGLQNKNIALALGISVSSVKGHIELLFKNLNVNNRTACVQAARDAKLI